MKQYEVYTYDDLVREPSSYLELQQGQFNNIFLNKNSLYFDIEDFEIFTPFITPLFPNFEYGGLSGNTHISFEDWEKISENLWSLIKVLMTSDCKDNFEVFISGYNYVYFKRLDTLLNENPKNRLIFVNYVLDVLKWCNNNFLDHDCFYILGI